MNWKKGIFRVTVLVSILCGITTLILHFEDHVTTKSEGRLTVADLRREQEDKLDHKLDGEGKIDLSDLTISPQEQKRRERRTMVLAGITSFSEGFISVWLLYFFVWWFAYELFWGVVLKRYIIEGGFKGKK